MKRLLCACLAALLLLTGGAALAAVDLDLSGMTLQELYDLRDRLDEAIELQEREEGPGFFEDGGYLVGQDIPEGDYALQEADGALFASIEIRSGDAPDAGLLLHKLVSGQADVRLRKNTWVILSGVRAWPLGGEPSRLGEDGHAPDGAYLVGAQLAAGRYRVVPDERAPLASYSVYSGILGTECTLTRFEVLHGETELTLSEGNYVELSGCALTPVGE